MEETETGRKLAEYVDNVRKVPRINSFFWLLRCADAMNKLADMEVGMKGDNRTGLAVLQMLLKYPEGISQQTLAKKTGRTKTDHCNCDRQSGEKRPCDALCRRQ